MALPDLRRPAVQCIKEKGDEIKAFTGANTTLGILIMRFDSMEQMLDMMDNSEKWIKIKLKE